MKNLCLLAIFLFVSISAFNQYTNYFIPVNFKQAYENHTRAMDGAPGTEYWQNRADYTIRVELNPENRLVSGEEIIQYFNNSPDTLEYLIIHLLPNLYKEGGIRDFIINPDDAFPGIHLDEIKIGNQMIRKNMRWLFVEEEENNLVLYLPDPLLPNDQIELEFKWNYTLNEKSHYREGVVDESSFFVAYFFPRVAVYDDIDGWNDWSYSGITEFYNDFGSFDVSVTVPENFMVWATGHWQNPDEILETRYLQLFEEAKTTDRIIGIFNADDLKKGNLLKNKRSNTFRYKADFVTDFAFGVSDHYLWDATSIVVDSASGRRVLIDAAYNPESADFYFVADIAKNAISYMSNHFPAIPFPYPKMTIFNGLSEMEYPMMVNDMSLPDVSETIKLTSHEIFHTYFPFLTGLNETKYAWMDEGLTSYGESIIATALDTSEYAGFYFQEVFEESVGHDFDMPLFTCSEYLSGEVYYFNSYPKAAIFFSMLHEYLGDNKFLDALHAFVDRWKGKHPTPHDLIFTFETVAKEDLSWIIKPWLFEYGYVDFGIERISNNAIMIRKIGHYPAPFEVEILYDDETSESKRYTAGIWKSGNTEFNIQTNPDKKVNAAKLTNVVGLDVNPENNNLITHGY